MSEVKPEVLASFAPSRIKLVVTFLGLLLFTAAGAVVLLSLEVEQLRQASTFGRAALWAVLVLCPVFAVDAMVRLIRRTPTLVATEEGLVIRSIIGFSAPIPWSEISGFEPVIMGKKPWLAVYLEDPNASFARLGIWTRLMHAKSHAKGVPNIAFRSIQLGAKPEEVAEKLKRISRNQTSGRS